MKEVAISVKYCLDPLLVDARLLGNDPGRQGAQLPNEAQPLGIPTTPPSPPQQQLELATLKNPTSPSPSCPFY